MSVHAGIKKLFQLFFAIRLQRVGGGFSMVLIDGNAFAEQYAGCLGADIAADDRGSFPVDNKLCGFDASAAGFVSRCIFLNREFLVSGSINIFNKGIVEDRLTVESNPAFS